MNTPAKTITIKIPVIVMSNGQWCAGGTATSSGEAEPYECWSDHYDLMDMESAPGSGEDATERRYYVRVTLELPELPETVDASAVVDA